MHLRPLGTQDHELRGIRPYFYYLPADGCVYHPTRQSNRKDGVEMRRFISIVFCLWAVVNSWGVEFQPISFRSTSAHFSTRTNSKERTAVGYTHSATSISASSISASNFANLNSEGGACYIPGASGPIRRAVSRPQADDNNEENLAIGETNFRSPIGDGTILLLFAALYAMRRKRRDQKGKAI